MSKPLKLHIHVTITHVTITHVTITHVTITLVVEANPNHCPTLCLLYNNYCRLTTSNNLAGTLCERPDIEHGEVTGPSTITPNSTLIIQCDTGYVMSHSDDVVCYSKAKFNPDPPTCDGKIL